MNPYEPPILIKQSKKYKEPIINWIMLLFVMIVTIVPFLIMIILQCLLEYV